MPADNKFPQNLLTMAEMVLPSRVKIRKTPVKEASTILAESCMSTELKSLLSLRGRRIIPKPSFFIATPSSPIYMLSFSTVILTWKKTRQRYG